jgi:diguanylate cyclase (GGDEF)-like protein/PAS domain S-box-containing protein
MSNTNQLAKPAGKHHGAGNSSGKLGRTPRAELKLGSGRNISFEVLRAAALGVRANSVVVTDRTGAVVWVNPTFTSVTGYSAQEVIGRTPRVWSSGQHAREFYQDLWDTILAGRAWHGTIVNRRKDKTLYREDVTIFPIVSDHGEILNFVSIKHDVTQHERDGEQLRQSEDKLRLILDSTAEAICGIDIQGRCTFSNPACLRLLGYKHADELLGRNMHALIHYSRPNGSPLPAEECPICQALSKGQGAHSEDDVFWKADGTSLPVEYWSYPQRKGGEVMGAVVAFIDISERKLAQERIQYLAYFDAVTGLPNRTLLEDRLSKAMAGAHRRKEKLALLFLDLDHFKVINDSLGHSAGDLVLKDVAGRLKKWVREQDTVARLGGDEFVILLNGVKDMGDVAVAAKRVLDLLTAEAVIEGRSLSLGCSLGISIFPDHGNDADTLIKHADAAMYCAKEKGRSNFQFFTPEMNAQVLERLNLESDLRGALQRNELFLMYQPQSDVATGRLIGAEALLRWQHPKLGLVPPDKFIRVAENSGLIIPIGEWVLRTALCPGSPLAGPGPARHSGGGECVRGPVSPGGVSGSYQSGLTRNRPSPSISRAGADRKPDHVQLRDHRLHVAPVEGDGGEAFH